MIAAPHWWRAEGGLYGPTFSGERTANTNYAHPLVFPQFAHL